MATEPYTLTARWLFPVDQPPLARGTLTVEGDRIVAVEKAGTRAADIDLGNVAILPGFTNAHTHLDLSDAVGKCPPTPDFTEWLRAVIAHRRQQSPADVAKAIQTGLEQCLRYGTTLVGDISAGGASWELVSKAPLRTVVFFELIGLTEERAKQSFEETEQCIGRSKPAENCTWAVSPHAPYSVRKSILEEIACWRLESGWNAHIVPVAMHIAESQAELELLEKRAGSFVEFLKELGAWDPAGLVPNIESIFEELKRHSGTYRSNLFIHGNYLAPAKLPGTLVYCPRTHAAFGHPPHPFRQFMKKGTCVALGTDSLASNPDLDVLAEARFVHERFPDLPCESLLRMATWYGAWALGREAITGSLEEKKSADFVLLPLPDDEAADPHDLILKSKLPISATVFRGKLAYSMDPHLPLPQA